MAGKTEEELRADSLKKAAQEDRGRELARRKARKELAQTQVSVIVHGPVRP